MENPITSTHNDCFEEKKARYDMHVYSIQGQLSFCQFLVGKHENFCNTRTIHKSAFRSNESTVLTGDLTKMTEFKHFFYLRHTVNVLFGFFLITQYFKLASLIFQGVFFCNGHKIYSESTGNKSNRLTRVYIHALNLKKKTSVLHRKKNLIIRQLNFKQKLI